jgi:chromosome segregation ATPase
VLAGLKAELDGQAAELEAELATGAAVQNRISQRELQIRQLYDSYTASQAAVAEAEDHSDLLANSLGRAADEAQRAAAAASHLRAELERRGAAVRAAQAKLEAAQLRLQLEGQQLGGLQQKVGAGLARGAEFLACKPVQLPPPLADCRKLCLASTHHPTQSHPPTHAAAPTCLLPALVQIQQLEAPRMEEQRRAEGLERELAALSKQQFRAGQALAAAQGEERRLGSEISGARAQGRNLTAAIARLEEQLVHQQVGGAMGLG